MNTLLKRKADQSIRNKDGQTALHWAAMKGHVEILQMLLHHGGKVNCRDKVRASGIGILMVSHT